MNPPTMRVPGGEVHAVSERAGWEFADEYACGVAIYPDDETTEQPPTCGNCLRVLRLRTPHESEDGDR